MMRVCPCDEPKTWGGVKRSSPSTRRPRRARWYAAALPIAPSPTTTTSCVTAPRVSEPGEERQVGVDPTVAPEERDQRRGGEQGAEGERGLAASDPPQDQDRAPQRARERRDQERDERELPPE